MSNDKKYEFTLPIGTVITGDVMPNSNGEHYQYHIESVLGQGGFGITYKVWSIVKNGRISTKVQFAIKEHFVKGRCHRGSDGVTVEYSREAAEDVEDSLKDFIKEGRLLQSICQVKDPSDPRNAGYQHIVPVNEVIEVNNTAYFVMQFLDGGSLRDMVLESGGGMDESRALSLMVPVCQAVNYIHSHGILHMDIKPENIVMRRNLETTQEEPVLIDFGVSLHFDKKGSLTTTHTSFGRTEGFSPMEQYGDISSFQPKIDVYALGATMFYLLSGKTPPSAFNVTQDFLEKNLPESVSERTRKAVLHAMSRDAHERTSSAKAFISELENRFTLPVGYVLHGPNCDYLLTAIHDVQSCYIRYDAVVYTGSARRANDRNMTVTTQYYVYECYSKQSCERHDDGTVSGKDGKDVDYRLQGSFLSEACQVTGVESVGDCEKSDVRVEREIFKGYGTLYAVVDKKYKPASGLSKAMGGVTKSLGDVTKSLGGIADSLKKHAKTIGIVAGVIVAVFLGWKFLSTVDFSSSSVSDDSAVADTTLVKEGEDAVQATVEKQKFSNKVLGDYLYTGPVNAAGNPDGKGEAVFLDKNGKPEARTYKGDFVNGVFESDYAEYVFYGDTYSGSFKSNYYDKGTLRLADSGEYFEGYFSKGQPHTGTWYNKQGKVLEKIGQ
jgi:serine/threonine protein kinase